MARTYPKVFISYSWDSDEHKIWVKDFADLLIRNGVNIILDQYDCPAGLNFLHFMEDHMSDSDYILIILTEKYKAKADGRIKGVGYEGMVISSAIYEDGLTNKFIPVLRQGETSLAIPNFLKSRAIANFRTDKNFETNFEELLKTIYNHSDKPEPGTPPDFLQKTTTHSVEVKKK